MLSHWIKNITTKNSFFRHRTYILGFHPNVTCVNAAYIAAFSQPLNHAPPPMQAHKVTENPFLGIIPLREVFLNSLYLSVWFFQFHSSTTSRCHTTLFLLESSTPTRRGSCNLEVPTAQIFFHLHNFWMQPTNQGERREMAVSAVPQVK